MQYTSICALSTAMRKSPEVPSYVPSESLLDSVDLTRQVEAHHFCTHLTPDFHQCIIYDSDAPDAKLIGIEYIVSEKVRNGHVLVHTSLNCSML
jgi:Protein of unknown function (DUF1264)